MKKKLFTYFFFVVLFTFTSKLLAQITPISITANPVSATCLGNGSVNLTTEGTQVGAELEYKIFLSPDFTNPVVPIFTESSTGPTFENTVTGLQAGTYKVVVTQTVGVESNSTETLFTIADAYVPLTYSISQSKECVGSSVTINVTAGTAASTNAYSIYSADGTTLLYGPQTDSVFHNIPDGTYLIKVSDSCGNQRTQTLVVSGAAFYFNLNTSNYLFSTSPDCSSILYDNTQYSSNVIFPITFTVSTADPVSGTPYTTSNTFNNISSFDLATTTLPKYTQDYQATFNITDACGNVYTTNKTINVTPSFEVTSLNSSCGLKYFQLYNYSMYSPNKTIQFLTYPSGFDPHDYNPVVFPDSGTYTGTSNDFSIIFIGNSTTPVPNGNYSVKITDDCGNTFTNSFTISGSLVEFNIIRKGYAPGCDGYSSFAAAMVVAGRKVGNVLTATITNAPTTYTTTFPLDVSSYIIDGTLTMYNLTPGSYTISVTSECGNYSNTFTVAAPNINDTFTVTKNCGSFNISFTSNNNIPADKRQGYYLLKYDDATATWVNPGSSNSIGYYMATNPTNNLAFGTGTYKVVFAYNSYGGQCTKDLGEFYYNSNPAINDFYVLQCAGGGISVIIDAEGVAPLKYEIISMNGDTSFYLDNGTSPVFTNLAVAQYTVKVTDFCGNSSTVNIDGSQSRLPRIRPSNLCDGQNGFLYVPGLSFMTISWSKGTDPTVIGTGNKLTFNPFSETTDVGLYYAHLSYAASTSSCTTFDITFDLQAATLNNPQAGTGQTVTIYSNQLPTSGQLNLVDYLSGTYDLYGEWSTTSSNQNLLIGNNWLAVLANSGTYTFNYTVNGPCSGTDVSTVTIKFIKICYNAYTSLGTTKTAKVGISTLNRTNTDWPAIVKGGILALDSKEKGFVITRMTETEISALSAVEGMLVYDITNNCLKLYNGTSWDCIQQGCNK